MADAGGARAAELLVTRLRHTELVGTVVAGAREMSARIADLPEQEIVDRVKDVLRAFLGAFPDENRIEEAARAAERTGADRALQGVPLLALLEAWQGGRAQIVAELVTAAPSLGLALEEVLEALVVVDARTISLQHRMIQAYRVTELDLARTRQATRAQTLRDLVTGRGHAALGDAGLDETGSYHCVLADVTATREARRLEPLIAGPDGLAGLVDGYLCCLTSRPPLSSNVGKVLLVVSPLVAVGELDVMYRLCRKALSAAHVRSYVGLHHLTDVLPEIAVDDQPDVGPFLVRQILRDLDATDEFHRLLAMTALTFLSSGGKAEEAATSLHVHVNTVKHRLRRLGEITGFQHSVNKPMVLTEQIQWWWALQSWLLPTGPTARGRGAPDAAVAAGR